VRTACVVALAIIAPIATATSCYHLPVWKGSVVVRPLARDSIRKCGTGALTADGQQRISREPYLQATTATSTTVAWGSTEGRGDVVLTEPGGYVIEAVPGQYVGEPAHKARRLGAGQDTPVDKLVGDDILVLAASFQKLQPNSLYCYQIVVNGAALTELAPLATAPEPGTKRPIRFIAVGDLGTGGDAERAIAQRMTEVPFDFLVVLGDLAYDSGTAQQIQNKFFAVYADILRYVPVFPAIGNHERRTRKGAPYFEAFVLPQPERYYSFDWGDVHFVAIDTTQRDSAQIAWLEQDLAKTQQRWKIVFGHHPMYTNSLRGPQQWIRRAYAKIFTDHQVDLVITGHEHQYERFRVANVNYVVSGGGGGQLTRFFGLYYSLKKAARHHYLFLEATDHTLSMKAIDISGNEIETVELTKETDDGMLGVKVDDKPETEQTPILPETATITDERLYDGPDNDTNRPRRPPVEIPSAPDRPTPPAVKEARSAAPPAKPTATARR
jgi:3',5'-cyclic AMP phosphodiesterase CpdA